MASFNYRLNPIRAIKECSSCGALYTADFCCSKEGLEDKILTLEELFLQDASESSDDKTNVVNAPQEPFVVNHDPGVNSSQSPPHIDDHCCYECGDSLDGIFCQRCTCKSCGKGAHIGYNCPPKVPIISNPEPCHNQDLNETLQNLQSLQQQNLLGTCQQCGCNEYDGVCFYCKVGNGTPIDFSTPYSFNESPNFSYHPTHSQPILCEFCGNDARYDHYCTPQVPIISNPEPCYDQNYDEFPQILPDCQQQILCCENYGGPHETYQCQPMNKDYYHEQNPCYDSNSFGFDQVQPPQSPVIHQPPQETSKEILQAKEDLMISVETFLKKFNRISFRETPKVLLLAWDNFLKIKHREKQHPPEDIQDLLHKLLEDVQNISEELAEFINSPNWNRPAIYYDDEYSFATQEYLMTRSIAITPVLPIKEPDNSLSMENEHLDTIPETESDEVIKSSVENLVQNPSESEDECECDLPLRDDSPESKFTNLSNPLFDANDDDTSSDEEDFKLSSNPLFDLDEVSPIDVEIDLLLDEFAGELTSFKSIPPGIDNINLDSEGDILFLESLLYDNSSPRPPEAFQANSNTIIESLLIPVDSLREEIDIFSGPDDSIPPDSTIVVVEDIPFDVPKFLPTHPTLHMDLDFIPSHNDFGSNLDGSSPSRNRHKIYDPGICIEVEIHKKEKISVPSSIELKLSDFQFHPKIKEQSFQSRISRIMKTLVLTVFALSLTRVSHPQLHFGNSDIQILSTNVLSFGTLETDIQEKEQKESQKTNQTKHGMERAKSKVSQVKKIQLEDKIPNYNCNYNKN
ncbi:hypothetical protein Tco_0223315 [Tanacetum coccineum]